MFSYNCIHTYAVITACMFNSRVSTSYNELIIFTRGEVSLMNKYKAGIVIQIKYTQQVFKLKGKQW